MIPTKVFTIFCAWWFSLQVTGKPIFDDSFVAKPTSKRTSRTSYEGRAFKITPTRIAASTERAIQVGTVYFGAEFVNFELYVKLFEPAKELAPLAKKITSVKIAEDMLPYWTTTPLATDELIREIREAEFLERSMKAMNPNHMHNGQNGPSTIKRVEAELGVSHSYEDFGSKDKRSIVEWITWLFGLWNRHDIAQLQDSQEIANKRSRKLVSFVQHDTTAMGDFISAVDNSIAKIESLEDKTLTIALDAQLTGQIQFLSNRAQESNQILVDLFRHNMPLELAEKAETQGIRLQKSKA